ncbi:MAG: DUF3501 family protein [Gammaproteobacteria bacterium]|nr:DUF3501 family protein [Gammaproteobacteria bacterium]
MEKLSHDNLYSLEQYARLRGEFRARVIEHKKPRRVSLGSNLNLYFEDRLTMQYQVQEMLRIERIFEPEAIDDELGAYNPLIPDGDNLKATMMLEYADVDERKRALAQLVGIENRIFIKIDDLEPVYAIADEDLERADAGKTSSVHFLRFQFEDEAVRRAKEGAAISVGVDHEHYRHIVEDLSPEQKAALVADFD